MKILILIDNDNDDAFSSLLASRSWPNVEIMTLDKLFNLCNVRFNAQDTKLDVSEVSIPDCLKNVLLINRLFSISPETVRNIAAGSEGICFGQITRVLTVILNKIDRVVGMPGMYSAVGHSLPLHMQYKFVLDSGFLIKCPSFEHGVIAEKVSTDYMESPIRKSTYDLYNWRSSSEKEGGLNDFVVDKPNGDPILLYFILDQVFVLPLKAGADVDAFIVDGLTKTALQVKKIFSAPCGEVLTIANELDFYFMSFSHSLNTAADDPSFSQAVEHVLEREMDSSVAAA